MTLIKEIDKKIDLQISQENFPIPFENKTLNSFAKINKNNNKKMHNTVGEKKEGGVHNKV